jgi:hypothetical protein
MTPRDAPFRHCSYDGSDESWLRCLEFGHTSHDRSKQRENRTGQSRRNQTAGKPSLNGLMAALTTGNVQYPPL